MTRVEVPTYRVDIWVGGDAWEAETICRKYCDDVGLCVSITDATFVYTGGKTVGMRVGLINYGRFPTSPFEIFARAETLALKLIKGLGQESASIVADDRTVWISFRQADD